MVQRPTFFIQDDDARYRVFEPGQVKRKTIELVFLFLDKACSTKEYEQLLTGLNQNDVSNWSNMATHELSIQWANTINIKLIVLV